MVDVESTILILWIRLKRTASLKWSRGSLQRDNIYNFINRLWSLCLDKCLLSWLKTDTGSDINSTWITYWAERTIAPCLLTDMLGIHECHTWIIMKKIHAWHTCMSYMKMHWYHPHHPLYWKVPCSFQHYLHDQDGPDRVDKAEKNSFIFFFWFWSLLNVEKFHLHLHLSGMLRWKTKGCSFIFLFNFPAEGYELSNTTGPEGVGAAANPRECWGPPD